MALHAQPRCLVPDSIPFLGALFATRALRRWSVPRADGERSAGRNRSRRRAPLAHAALEGDPACPLRRRLEGVLDTAGVEDSERVFAAIRLAAPAGLGASERHDVRLPAAAPLVDVMREAADRDRVARQYARCFEDVFDHGLAALVRNLARWPGVPAVVGLYLAFLARFKDSRIERKLGFLAAEGGRLEARRLVDRLEASDAREMNVEERERFDRSLKRRRINPETCVDLTVATLLAGNLLPGRGNRAAAQLSATH